MLTIVVISLIKSVDVSLKIIDYITEIVKLDHADLAIILFETVHSTYRKLECLIMWPTAIMIFLLPKTCSLSPNLVCFLKNLISSSIG